VRKRREETIIQAMNHKKCNIYLEEGMIGIYLVQVVINIRISPRRILLNGRIDKSVQFQIRAVKSVP
jgi:hypothetical protein